MMHPAKRVQAPFFLETKPRRNDNTCGGACSCRLVATIVRGFFYPFFGGDDYTNERNSAKNVFLYMQV